MRGLLSNAEALVALLHQLDDIVRRELVALRFRRRGSVHAMRGGSGARTIVTVAMPAIVRKPRRFRRWCRSVDVALLGMVCTPSI